MYVGQGQAEESLGKFWKRLRHSGAKIQAVAMDLINFRYCHCLISLITMLFTLM